MEKPFMPSDTALDLKVQLQKYDIQMLGERYSSMRDVDVERQISALEWQLTSPTDLITSIELSLDTALSLASSRVSANNNVFVNAQRKFGPIMAGCWNVLHIVYSHDGAIRPVYEAFTQAIAADAYDWAKEGVTRDDYRLEAQQDASILLLPTAVVQSPEHRLYSSGCMPPRRVSRLGRRTITD